MAKTLSAQRGAPGLLFPAQGPRSHKPPSEDGSSCMLKLRPGTARKINTYFEKVVWNRQNDKEINGTEKEPDPYFKKKNSS